MYVVCGRLYVYVVCVGCMCRLYVGGLYVVGCIHVVGCMW